MLETIIAVDFDDTICKNEYPEIGDPIPDAIKWLKKFQKEGAKIILFTMRGDKGCKEGCLTDAANYLIDRGIELFGINENPEQSDWTNSPKPFAHIYIDDRAFGCPLYYEVNHPSPMVNWNLVGPPILNIIRSRNNRK